MNPANGIFPSLHGDQLAPTVICQRKCIRDIRMHLDSLVELGYMNKDVASSMKDSADGVSTDDEGNEYMCLEKCCDV
eukprot:15365061-Ditylum_brightwellii.AAC.1